MNLIESLKQNERPFGLCSKEEQECLKGVDRKNLQYFAGASPTDWKGAGQGFVSLEPLSTYRIKPDYQPEPQIERCEVKERVCVLTYTRQEKGWVCLHNALSDPDFMGFQDADGNWMEIRPRRDGKPADIPKFVVFRKR